LTNDVLSGTVKPPVGGVLKARSTVTMGLGLGRVSGDTCSLFANSFTTPQAGATSRLSGTIGSNGTYCVQGLGCFNPAGVRGVLGDGVSPVIPVVSSGPFSALSLTVAFDNRSRNLHAVRRHDVRRGA
jgi:hypothetical protein